MLKRELQIASACAQSRDLFWLGISFNTHLTDRSRDKAWERYRLWQSRAIFPATVSMHMQSKADFTCTTPDAYSILHTSWDQFEIWSRHFNMTIVMWKAAAHTAVSLTLHWWDSGHFPSEAQTKQLNVRVKDEQMSIKWLLTEISAGHHGYKNPACQLSS